VEASFGLVVAVLQLSPGMLFSGSDPRSGIHCSDRALPWRLVVVRSAVKERSSGSISTRMTFTGRGSRSAAVEPAVAPDGPAAGAS